MGRCRGQHLRPTENVRAPLVICFDLTGLEPSPAILRPKFMGVNIRHHQLFFTIIIYKDSLSIVLVPSVGNRKMAAQAAPDGRAEQGDP